MDKKVLLQDLADGVARKRNIPKKDAENFLRVVFDVIGEFLQTDKIVKVRGLGTFKLVTVDSRESVDVNTGERITIKEYTKVNFTPDPVLRDAVNKPFAQFETVVLYDGTKLEDMERMDFPDLPEPEAAETGMVPSLEERPEVDLPATENVEMENPANLSNGTVDDFSIETASIEEGWEEAGEETPENQAIRDDETSLGEMAGEPENVVDSNPVAEEGEDVGKEASDEVGKTLDGSKDFEPEEEADVRNAANETGNPKEERPAAQSLTSSSDEDNGMGQEPVQTEVRDVHVEKQQIEVQKVEHQTVNNQHIVQMLPKDDRKRVYLTPWMIFFLVLLVLAMMGISYYVGYNHLLTNVEVKEEAGKTVLPKQEKAIVDKKSNIVVDSMPEKPDTTRQVVRDSLPSKKEEAPSAVTKAASPKKNPVTSTKEVYPQVKNGAYEIVGTQEEHRLRRGETLRGLALRYYGSKDFTVYIVAYNKIANPDVVPEGMVLKMPKLELKRR